MRIEIVRSGRIAHFGVAALVGLCLVGPGSATGAKGPRIVAAAMLDLDRDAKADAIRLRFSKPIVHVRDADGKYPFVVKGYRIARVSAASGRTLTLGLVERATPDAQAHPTVRYRTTRSKPVTDRQKHQAIAQLFKATTAHGHAPPTAPTPPPPPAPGDDPDKDGYSAPADCKPNDPAIHPDATDRPDLAFIDTNCDGIDGDEARSIFVSPTGTDANPGTRTAPKREVQAAIAALGTRRDVIVAGGNYLHSVISSTPSGIGIFGGYDAQTWVRATTTASVIAGQPEGVLIESTQGVVLQLLTITGSASGAGSSAYGVRVYIAQPSAGAPTLTLQRVTAGAGPGLAGAAGIAGTDGRLSADGYPGRPGSCDGSPPGAGGIGGPSPIGRAGGNGGRGATEGANVGLPGETGQIGTPGGAGGSGGFNGGGYGEHGTSGSDGIAGRQGLGGTAEFAPGRDWFGQSGTSGAAGTHGNGGGGGGGSGGQGGPLVDDGSGNGGGGGGAGGEAGGQAGGGGAGGGSFGLYLYGARVVIEASAISAGSGGAGGRGGNGGIGAVGGAGGSYQPYCFSEIGSSGGGGKGGRGGNGGGGGGGAGGPSIGILKLGSTVTSTNVEIGNGTGGPGGANGSGGTPSGAASVAGRSLPVFEVALP